jgi:hypothetical protein
MQLARQQRITQPNPGIRIKVLDLTTNQETIYPSLSAVTLSLKINNGTLSRRIKSNITKPYKKRYIISQL